MSVGKTVGTKLSVRSFVSSTDIAAAVLGKRDVEHFICRFGGVATGLKPYQNNYKRNDSDDDTKYGILGQFEAIGWDGTSQSGSTLYLPGAAHALVESALNLADTAGVRIGFDVYARFDEKAATKYVFVVRDLLNETSESVSSVMNTLGELPMPKGSSMKVLDAPKS